MNFSEQLDKFVERGAEEFSNPNKLSQAVVSYPVWNHFKSTEYTYKSGAASLKPIVLKQQEIILKILGQPFQGDWDAQAVYICKSLAEISQMLEGGSK